MTSAEFNKLLDEGHIPPLLLLHGEERYLLEGAVKRITDLTVPPDARDFNWQRFRGKEVVGTAVLDAARTFPVFNPRRLVFVQDAQDVPASEMDALLDYLRDPVPETILLITAEKIDARRKFFQEFKKKGRVVEFRRLKDYQIPAFIKEQARSEGKSFTEGAMELLSRRLGNDLQDIHEELNKLFSYAGQKTLIDVSDVSAVVSDSRIDSVFDLTNAMGERRTDEALRLLGRLLDEGGVPLVLLTMIVRHFRNLWKTRQLIEERQGRGEIARRIEVNPYFVDGLMTQSRQFTAAEYRMMFERFLTVDMALKSSGAHPAALLEGLILEICRGGEGRKGK